MGTSKKQAAPMILMLTGSLDAGGKERQLINLLKFLNESDRFRVGLAVINPGGLRENEANQHSDKYFLIKRLFSADLVSPIIHLPQIIQTNEIKLIHTWGSGLWDLVGMIVAKLCGIPFLHGGIRSAPSSLDWTHHLSRWAAKYADLVVSNSLAGLQAFNIKNISQTQVIYNGVDFSQFNQIQDEVIPNRIGMVSNFRAEKDHNTLLLAMPEIIQAIPDTHLYLVGRDFGTLSKLRMLIEQLGLNDHVHIIADCLDPQPIVAKWQVSILSTFGEGFSNVILEYMALSKPVVATHVGGNPEIIIHGVTGCLVPKEDPKGLARAVIDLLKDPQKCQRIGQASYENVNNKYSVPRMGKAYEDLYGQLIK